MLDLQYLKYQGAQALLRSDPEVRIINQKCVARNLGMAGDGEIDVEGVLNEAGWFWDYRFGQWRKIEATCACGEVEVQAPILVEQLDVACVGCGRVRFNPAVAKGRAGA